MRSLKLFGALLILISSSWMGILGGKRLADRPQQLQKIKSDLMLLETDINYAATPLPQILEKMAYYSQWPVSCLWHETWQQLTNGEGLMAEQAWEKSLASFAPKTALIKKDLNILRDFGVGLGFSNRQEQIKKFKLLQEQLSLHQHEAENIRQKNERMWRTMGILGGIILIVLLY